MLTAFMHFASFIGSAGFYLPVLIVVFWCVAPRFGARSVLLLAFSAALNGLLKLTIREPRPFWTDPSIVGREGRSSFGMPSGHAQNAVVTWGFLATRTRRRWMWAGAAVVIVLIGVSRIHLGVHSPAQVVAGWTIGAIVLTLVIRLEPVVVPWWRGLGLTAHVGLSLVVTAAFLVPTMFAIDAHSGWVFPETWAAKITESGGTIQPVTVVDGAMTAGGVFGVLLGISVLDRRGWFEAGGSWPRRLGRIPVGVAGAGVIVAIWPVAGDHPVGAFLVQTMLGLWAIAGAPEVFVRLGLATRHLHDPCVVPAPAHGENARIME